VLGGLASHWGGARASLLGWDKPGHDGGLVAFWGLAEGEDEEYPFCPHIADYLTAGDSRRPVW
jgi:hypothetical protein